MKRLLSISLWAMALLVGICLTACTDYRDDVDTYVYDGKTYLKIKFSMSTTTRAANPQGGENGDGREVGNANENAVKNVSLFIFRNSFGFDADPGTTFLYKRYFDNTYADWTTDGTETTITFEVDGYEPADGDRVIVVANAGNLTSIGTLGLLRNHTTYSAWHNGASISDNDFFVMSSAYNNGVDGIVHVTGHTGAKSDPYISALDIQRTAARIDFMYHTSDNYSSSTPDELFYNVMNSTGTDRVATVHLENIIPVNLMQESSYLIRRVTSSADVASAVNHGAKETVDGSGIPNRYVIEPHTSIKQGSVVDSKLNDWYGTTCAKTVFTNPTGYLTKTNIAYYNAGMTQTVDELLYFNKAMTLAYTNENTQSKEKHSPDFMTGLLLKTVYKPKTVYRAYDAGTKTLTEETGYTKGTTFYRYTPTKASMVEEDSKYFTSSTAATAYKTAHPEDLAEIVEYVNGVCYYNLWLRHANVDSNPHTTFPMEYGIVRNNIYRVGVEKFTGPGTPTPSYEGPEHVRLRIFVRPWNRRVHPEILL